MGSSSRDILLFSGQGSNQHLANPGSIQTGLELLSETQRQAFNTLLLRCRDAFHLELRSASPEDQTILSEEVRHVFHDPESILFPPPEFQTHPVFETLTLYIHQILELMLLQAQEPRHYVVEVAGVCTGILPASLAASYRGYDSQSFLNAALEGFRLAFWIGFRSALQARELPDEERGDDNGSCLLGVYGVTFRELEEKLSEFLIEHPNVHISAIFSDKNLSVSGPSPSLERVKEILAQSSIQFRSVAVHAVYHGGKDLESSVQAILADVERRDIKFPTWDSLLVPLRSVSNGHRVDSQRHDGLGTLLESSLRGIFIDRVDWNSAARATCKLHQKLLEKDSGAKARFIGLGPGSRTLGHTLKEFLSHPRCQRIDNWSEYLSHPAPEDIAIVGLSVHSPNGNGQEKFWEALENAVATVREIPSSRFVIPESDDKDGKSKKKEGPSNTRFGNFLDKPFDFDAQYFNISPREAKSMDPQQRLLLHSALEALEDAGYSPNSTPTFRTETFGVYTGIATCDYVDNLRDDIDVYYSPGTLRAFLSGRISYAFKFKGPSMVVDTACSSSMVALYQACKALRDNECTAALAMGVNTMTSPDMYCGLGRAHFLSPTGQCKPFDISADGYCRAEGSGAVVVKKLSDAIAEGDNIYGVIRGICVNQCGTAKSITHPDADTQAELMRAVLKQSRVSSQSIGAVEAHGTGTQAGDFAECSSLRSVFHPRPKNEPLHVSSVKGNFGHAEAASGLFGLAKLLMMIDKKKLTPQASHKKLNPRLKDLVEGCLNVPVELEDWPRHAGTQPRRALLNNFGASGSNVALIIEEWTGGGGSAKKQIADKAPVKRSHQLLNITAKTEQALDHLRQDYVAYLKKNSKVSMEDFCYSVNSRRQDLLPWRASVTATERSELVKKLSEPLTPTKIPQNPKPRKTVFAFSGQGGVHVGMGADLLKTAPHYAQVVEGFDAVLRERGYPAVLPFLSNTVDESKTSTPEEDLIISQCACFVVEYALASLLMSWGVVPDILVGHSIGEYAAFAIANAIEPNEALLLVAARARLMATRCRSNYSGMLASRISTDTLDKMLADDPIHLQGITISCLNSPQDLVLAGPLHSLEAFAKKCKADGIKSKLLPVPFGFHSKAMDPILSEFSELTAKIPLRTPSIRIASSFLGRVLGADEVIEARYFVEHARETVKFSDAIKDLANWAEKDEITVLEAGPSPSTDPMFKSALSDKPVTFMATLRPNQPPWGVISQALQSLFLNKQSVNWRAVYEGSDAKFEKSIPPYPLNKSSYYVPYKPPTSSDGTISSDLSRLPRYAFLTEEVDNSVESKSTFLTSSQEITPFVKAHSVGGVPLCPASVYLEVVLQAAAQRGQMDTEAGVSIFENVSFEHPFVVSEEEQSSTKKNSMKTEVENTEANEEVVQFMLSSGSDNVHCSGKVRCSTKSSKYISELFTRKMMQVKRLQKSLDAEPASLSQTFNPRTIYNLLFPRVVEYGDPFLTLQTLTLSHSGLDGHGVFRLAPTPTGKGGSYIASPALIDTLLHVAGFMANTYVSSDIACICTSIDQTMICSYPASMHGEDLRVFCTVGDIDHSFIADAYALDPDGRLVAYAEGLSFKKIKLKSFKAHLSRAVSRTNSTKASEAVKRHAVKESAGKPQKPQKVEVPAQARVDGKPKAMSILREICGLDNDPEMSNTLEQLGVDSLLLIELGEQFKQSFPGSAFDKGEIENCETIQDIINLVTKHTGQAPSDVPSLVNTSAPSPAATDEGAPQTPPPASGGDQKTIIRTIFMDVCGMDPDEGKDQELSLLGVDSLMSIELFEELRGQLGIEIDPHSTNISEMTYKQLESLCASKSSPPPSGNNSGSEAPSEAASSPREGSTSSSQSSAPSVDPPVETCAKLLQQSSNNSNADLFLIHDGSGLCSMYGKLASVDRNLYGVYSLESPSASPSNQDVDTLEDLAARYIQSAGLGTRPDVILGGWSFGGVLAFEVSRQLAKQGKPIKGLILVDSPVPIKHQPLPQSVIEYVVGRGGPPSNSKGAQQARATIQSQFTKHAEMLRKYNPDSAATSDKSAAPTVFLRCVRTMDTDGLCGTPYPWLSNSDVNKESIKKWEGVIGRPVPVLNLDCDHFEAFDSANAIQASKMLKEACRLIETGSG